MTWSVSLPDDDVDMSLFVNDSYFNLWSGRPLAAVCLLARDSRAVAATSGDDWVSNVVLVPALRRAKVFFDDQPSAIVLTLTAPLAVVENLYSVWEIKLNQLTNTANLRTFTCTVFSELIGFCFSFSLFFVSVPCARLSWPFVSF